MNSNINTVTVCDVCGYEEAHIRPTARTYGKGTALLVIENVPVVNCANCGSSYLTASTLKQINRIKRDRRTLATPKSVDVASFSVAQQFPCL